MLQKLCETADKKSVYYSAEDSTELYSLENAEAEEGEWEHNSQNSAEAVVSGLDLVYVASELLREFFYDQLVRFGWNIGMEEEGYRKRAEDRSEYVP